ncbi:hypothetical protein, partial [Weissella confusa]|uniref:hypothetical protein n=1 Tax=Weissella confusa TaxID=1583 RepID=UPI001A7E9A08
ATSCLLLFPEKYSRIASSFVCFDILVIKKNPESYFNFRGTPHRASFFSKCYKNVVKGACG